MLPKERLAGEAAVATVVDVSHCRVPADPTKNLPVSPCAWAASRPHRIPNEGCTVDVEGRSLDLFLGWRLSSTNPSTSTLTLAPLLRLSGSQTRQVVHIPWRGWSLTPHRQLEVKVSVHGEVAAEGGILVAGVAGHQLPGRLRPMLRQ